jgi:hypothetical protein
MGEGAEEQGGRAGSFGLAVFIDGLNAFHDGFYLERKMNFHEGYRPTRKIFVADFFDVHSHKNYHGDLVAQLFSWKLPPQIPAMKRDPSG